MPTIHVQAQLSGEDLLRAAEQLSPPEFEQFVARVLTLRANRGGGRVSAPEADLLQRINRGLPAELRGRSEALIAKRQAGTLTPDGHDELIRITETIEDLEADRAAALAELARLRGVTLAAMAESLGLAAAPHA